MITGSYRDRKYVMGDKIIVMSFPGTGKTEAVKNYPSIFTEVDASDYYWGGLPIPPCEDIGEFPKNYVDKIEEVLEDSSIKASIVLVCNHVEVAQELRDRKIKFCVVTSNRRVTMNGLKRAGYCNHIIEYFEDVYSDYVTTLHRQCDGSILSTGCMDVSELFLGHRDPLATYRHIIHYFNRSV